MEKDCEGDRIQLRLLQAMKDQDIADKTFYDLTDEQIDELTVAQAVQVAENFICDKDGNIVLDCPSGLTPPA